jgi:hypothetical protein
MTLQSSKLKIRTSLLQEQRLCLVVRVLPTDHPRESSLTCKWNHHFHISFWHLCSQGKAARVCAGRPRAQTTPPGPGAWDGPPVQRQCPRMEACLSQQCRFDADYSRVKHWFLPWNAMHRQGCVRVNLVLSDFKLKLLDGAQWLPEALPPNAENKVHTIQHPHLPFFWHSFMLLKGSFHVF